MNGRMHFRHFINEFTGCENIVRSHSPTEKSYIPILLPWQEQITMGTHWTNFSSGIHHFFYFYLLFASPPLKYDATLVLYRERWTSCRKSFRTNNILEVSPFSVLLFSSQQLHRGRELFIRSHARAPQTYPFLLLSTEAKEIGRPIRWRGASLFCQKVHKPNWRIAFENSFFFLAAPESFVLALNLFSFLFQTSYIFCRTEQHKVYAVRHHVFLKVWRYIGVSVLLGCFFGLVWWKRNISF